MQKTMRSALAVLLVVVCLLTATACGAEKEADLWDTAAYTKDTTLGDGAKTVKVEVKAEEKTVTFTVKTDEETVGAALLAHNLIAGEQGDYGLYIKTVNGITADFDKDQHYWAFYIDGEYAMSGVDTTAIDEDVTYQLAYSK